MLVTRKRADILHLMDCISRAPPSAPHVAQMDSGDMGRGKRLGRAYLLGYDAFAL